MNWIKERKYEFLGLALIVLLFVGSLLVRKDNLGAPLGRHHEWITAHALITAEIWDQNGGPSTYGFNPVYTYPGEGNAYRRMLGGITAENGDVYYVSYPPFSFLFLYYSTQFLGGPTVFNVRVVSVLIHLLSALLLYFLLLNLKPEPERKTFIFSGVIAAGLYLFAQGNLWFHGNLYFSDTLVQPFFFGGLLLSVRYFNGYYKREKRILLLLFIIFFLATYTEWLGLLQAFFTGIIFLILALAKKKKAFLRPFGTIALASSLALGLTLFQYSSIDGWESLKTTSETKYAERSGHGTTQDSAAQFNIHNGESFDHLISKFNSNYKSLENYTGFSIGALILALIAHRFWFSKSQKSMKKFVPGGAITFVLTLGILPVLSHYLLFFNFNSMHDFSGIKTSGLLIIITGIVIQILYTISRQTHRYYALGIITFFSIFFLIKSKSAVKRYAETHRMEMIDTERIASAKIIAQKALPENAVLTNVRLSPEQVYYAKHSITPINTGDTTAILNILKLHRNQKGQYYHHDGSKLKSMVNFELRGENLVFLDTLFFE